MFETDRSNSIKAAAVEPSDMDFCLKQEKSLNDALSFLSNVAKLIEDKSNVNISNNDIVGKLFNSNITFNYNLDRHTANKLFYCSILKYINKKYNLPLLERIFDNLSTVRHITLNDVLKKIFQELDWENIDSASLKRQISIVQTDFTKKLRFNDTDNRIFITQGLKPSFLRKNLLVNGLSLTAFFILLNYYCRGSFSGNLFLDIIGDIENGFSTENYVFNGRHYENLPATPFINISMGFNYDLVVEFANNEAKVNFIEGYLMN